MKMPSNFEIKAYWKGDRTILFQCWIIWSTYVTDVRALEDNEDGVDF